MELHIAFLNLFSPMTFMVIGYFYFVFEGIEEEFDTKVWILPLAWFLATFFGTIQNQRILFLFNFPAVLFAGYGLRVVKNEIAFPYINEGLAGLKEGNNDTENN